MPRKPTGKPTGRPVRDFDKAVFEELCHINCTMSEIEKIFHTQDDVLKRWCERTYGASLQEIYHRYSDGGKASIRRNQIKLSATNGSVAIWLGKCLLGQRDPQEADNTQRIVGALENIRRLEIVNECRAAIKKEVNEQFSKRRDIEVVTEAVRQPDGPEETV
jgi:hypothetical protein